MNVTKGIVVIWDNLGGRLRQQGIGAVGFVEKDEQRTDRTIKVSKTLGLNIRFVACTNFVTLIFLLYKLRKRSGAHTVYKLLY